MSETTEKNTKRVATAYLPSGKELRFVFDEYYSNEGNYRFSLEGKRVASIPLSIPILFHNLPSQQDELERQKEYGEMCDKLHRAGFGIMGVQHPTITQTPRYPVGESGIPGSIGPVFDYENKTHTMD